MSRVQVQVRRALICGMALTLMLTISFGQSKDERAVRAAYVYNLAKLIQWPVETDQIVIGYLGDHSTGEFLHKMLDGTVNDSKHIRVVLFPPEDELRACNMLYIAESRAKTRTILGRLGHANVVTIGEASTFAQDGEMIGLVEMGDHIQMEFNVEAAQRGGIRFGPGLLDVATAVSSGPTSPSADRKLVRRSEPEYPELAAKVSLHGTVKLKASIARDGTVRQVECIGGHPVLGESAMAAVKTWRYEVASQESTLIIELKF